MKKRKKSVPAKSISLKTKNNKTPKKLSSVNRIPTYIAGFDKLIEGGFKKKSSNVLVGGAGNGKSIFSVQFLVGGMLKGEKTLYVTFEEKKEEFYQNMLRFGWDLAELEKKGLFNFLEYTPIKVKTMLEEGGGAIENIILEKKVSRMIIDSLTSFTLLFDDELERREASLGLFNMLRRWNCTTLLTLESKPHTEGQISRTIEFESDAIILFYFLRDKEERQRYIEILKMRGTKHSKKTYHFKITDKGIIIDNNPSSKKLNFQ